MKFKPWLVIQFLVLITVMSCQENPQKIKVEESVDVVSVKQKVEQQPIINVDGITIKERIRVPAGFERTEVESTSFANYLRTFKLKPHGSPVLLYDGERKSSQHIHAAVLDIDTGKRDLQQCADATMRLRAEYLWRNEQFEDIQFNFTNGFPAKYTTWRKGNRIKVSGNQVEWYATNRESKSYAAFRQYLDMVFMYAGTLSLSKELESKSITNISIGDIFVQGGSPGHAIIVIDKAVNLKSGHTLVCLAQSYMPAQDIHILNNLQQKNISPWFTVDTTNTLLNTPEWTFKWNDLKQF